MNNQFVRKTGPGRVILFSVFAAAAFGQAVPTGTSPALYYSSAKAGPNQGWENSPTRGAAITVWGKNFGSARGGSYITVAGVHLTSDSDYAEWGATTNPTTAKGFQRITFWLNSSMPVGNTGGVSVTVSGVTSNVLPFTINNTGVIRFVDYANGDDSWDGGYANHSSGGTHGPWKSVFTYYARAGTGPGMFLYLRGGTYSGIFEPGSGHPDSAYVGLFEPGTSACNVYYPLINGTDALRYTVASYPGEMAIFRDVELLNLSSYWTMANFKWVGTSAKSLWAVTFGGEQSMCGNCTSRSVGLDMIGMEFGGVMHHVLHSFGDNFRILANYMNVTPIGGGGFDIDTSYILYPSAGDGLLIKDNELHGGAMYPIHHYDEHRGGCTPDMNRSMTNSTFDSNWIDLTRDATTPTNQRAGILTALSLTPDGGNVYRNTVIKNNVFFSRDNLVSEAAVIVGGSNFGGTIDGVHIYNNTMYNVPWAVWVPFDTTAHWRNVDFTNNIVAVTGAYDWYTDSGAALDISPLFSYNLVSQAPRINGNATVRNNIIGAPGFLNPPFDFHIAATSPARDAGVALAGVTLDYDSNPRPQGSTYDIGAYEYAAAGGAPPVSVSLAPSSVTLFAGQSQQFSASVSGTTNTAVSWSISPSVGSVSSSGLYVAPALVQTQQSVVITATSMANPSKSATVTVTLAPPISMAMSPASVSLGATQSQAFTATVSGTTNTAMTWSLNPVMGTVSANGQYTAPGTITTQQTVIVTATSAIDTTKSASATITLTPAISVTISPATVSRGAGQTQQFTASVSGTSNTAATWSMNPALGTLSSTGLYTAPASITSQQTVTVTATSVANTTKSASATVTLTPAVSVATSPTTVSRGAGQTQQFTASVSGTANTAVTWSMNPALGTLSSTGLYTAPSSIASQQVVTVIATSAADTTKSANATVTLTPTVSVSASPTTVSRSAGQTQQFTASVSGTTNTAVTWSMNPVLGTLSSTGLYTAPTSIVSQQTVTVTATSVANTTKSASAVVTLVPAAPSVPSVPSVPSGAQTFTVSWTDISPTQIRVTWTAPAGQPDTDWLALSGVGAIDWWSTSWAQYKGTGTTGSIVINKPPTPGYYEIRYYLRGGYTIAARSAPIPIGVQAFQTLATPTVVAVGAPITVTWTAPGGRPGTDEIGLYQTGALNADHGWYRYTNGATGGTWTFNAPTTPGTYELRYRIGWLMAAKSATITVR